MGRPPLPPALRTTLLAVRVRARVCRRVRAAARLQKIPIGRFVDMILDRAVPAPAIEQVKESTE
jgi:hypothetical protein